MITWYARHDVPYSGGEKQLSITFPYIKKEHIKVFVNDVETTEYHFLNESQIFLDCELNTGDIMSVRRNTPIDEQMVTFTDTSIVNAEKQNLAQKQLFNTVQELYDNTDITLEKNKQETINRQEAFEDEVNTKIEMVSSAAEKINQLEEAVDTAVTAADTASQKADDIEQFVAEAISESQALLQEAEEALNETKQKVEEVEGMLSLEIGDIGIAPLGIDETKGKRRYLNGQLIIQDQYIQFTNKVKSAVALYPSLACTEEEWQTTATMTVGGQVGKFVVDNEAGTIRLPKIIMPIQGLTDLSKLGEIVEAGLPNISAEMFSRGNSAGYGSVYPTSGVEKEGAFSLAKNSSEHTAGAISISGNAQSDVVNFNASKSNPIYKDGSTVQQEQIQYPYFIQVATGAETEDNIINEIELNNPYSLGDSKYSPIALNNLSWLKSEGQWNSKAVYPAYYDWVLVNANKGKENFIGLNMYGWGSSGMYYLTSTLNVEVGSVAYGGTTKRAVAVITEVNKEAGTITIYNPSQNKYEENLPRYTVQDQSSSEFISDYDWVINPNDETFRLPLLDGSEDLVSDKYENWELLESGATYTAPANGWIQLSKSCTANDQFVLLGEFSGMSTIGWSGYKDNAAQANIYITKGRTIPVYYSAVGSAKTFKFYYAKGNGSLYFYVGETVQNANLVNIGRIQETYTTKSMVDGQWVNAYSSLLSNYTIPANATSDTQVDLSNYLPNDGYDYEVIIEISGQTGTTNGNQAYILVASDKIRYLPVCSARTFAASTAAPFSGNANIPIGAGRYIWVRQGITAHPCTLACKVHAYRRLGTNL